MFCTVFTPSQQFGGGSIPDGTFNMPTSYQLWVWERDANINWSMVTCQAALVRNYLEVYWPHAGGLSAVNAIGTQLRDPINSGLTQWRMAVGYKWINGRRRGTREEYRK